MHNKNYKALLESLNKRSNPDNILLEKSFSDELGQVSYNESITYIKKAMRGVEPEYTQRTIQAGKQVRDNLAKELSNVTFEFQGSVMTNTHIKGYSDIDLLAITEKFYTFDRVGINQTLNNANRLNYTYSQILVLNEVLKGGGYHNGLTDLRMLRLNCEAILNKVYLYVDTTKPKSIIVNPTSPSREVDVVIANWYNNANYYLQGNKDFQGIEVFVKGEYPYLDKTLPVDFPFLSIKRINEKNILVGDRLKKMIRFLKTIKVDSGKSDELNLSSFDIYAICYAIETYKYSAKNDVELVYAIYNQFDRILKDYSYRFNLISVDDHEYIFRNPDKTTENTEKVKSLKVLFTEIQFIINDMITGYKLTA